MLLRSESTKPLSHILVSRNVAGIVLLTLALTAWGDSPADLKATMPDTVFTEAGLDRLSDTELAALEAWIGTTYGPPKTLKPQRAAAPATTLGAEQVAPAPEPVDDSTRARIRGPFSGWSGDTLFKLDNGQVWRQRIGGRYRYKADSPEIEIYKGRFGYYLRVLKTGRQIGVRRLK